jgi:hypothetical protein
VAKKGCASRQGIWLLWSGRNAIGGEKVKNRRNPLMFVNPKSMESAFVPIVEDEIKGKFKE